jgi:uncharacterized phage-associated protein
MGNKKFKFTKEDFILYILNKLEPDKSDKIRLNKMAFFVEFAYLLNFGQDLSDANYAAINKGPVIDGYDSLLKSMQTKRLIKIDNYVVRPLKSPAVDIPTDIRIFMDSIMDKYSKLKNEELYTLSHSTDSYKITTNNEKKMGRKISKKLAILETFLADDESQEEEFSEDSLPKINRSNLVQYAR